MIRPSVGDQFVIPRGDFNKLAIPGDIVHYGQHPRLIVAIGKHCLFLVRFGSSYLWRKRHRGKGNPVAGHDLPQTVIMLKQATPETIEIAKEFNSWKKGLTIDRKIWDRVCQLGADAIMCECPK